MLCPENGFSIEGCPLRGMEVWVIRLWVNSIKETIISREDMAVNLLNFLAGSLLGRYFLLYNIHRFRIYNFIAGFLWVNVEKLYSKFYKFNRCYLRRNLSCLCRSASPVYSDNDFGAG
jgi:hypothetical protein